MLDEEDEEPPYEESKNEPPSASPRKFDDNMSNRSIGILKHQSSLRKLNRPSLTGMNYGLSPVDLKRRRQSKRIVNSNMLQINKKDVESVMN